MWKRLPIKLASDWKAFMSARVDSWVRAMSIATSSVSMSSRLRSFSWILVCLIPIISCPTMRSPASTASRNRHFSPCILHLVMNSSTDSDADWRDFCRSSCIPVECAFWMCIEPLPQSDRMIWRRINVTHELVQVCWVSLNSDPSRSSWIYCNGDWLLLGVWHWLVAQLRHVEVRIKYAFPTAIKYTVEGTARGASDRVLRWSASYRFYTISTFSHCVAISPGDVTTGDIAHGHNCLVVVQCRCTLSSLSVRLVDCRQNWCLTPLWWALFFFFFFFFLQKRDLCSELGYDILALTETRDTGNVRPSKTYDRRRHSSERRPVCWRGHPNVTAYRQESPLQRLLRCAYRIRPCQSIAV